MGIESKAGAAKRDATAVAGKVVAAGRQSAELIAQLLALDVAGPPYAVRAVAWQDHALEATVQVSAEEDAEVVARIEGRGPNSEGMIKSDHLILYFRLMGVELPRDLVTVLMEHAPERLRDWTVERLAEAIASDPELGKPGLAMPAGVDEQERARSLLDTWGDDTAYADFFAAGEMARAQLDSLAPDDLFAWVQHSDLECMYVNPHSVAPTVWLINFPWLRRIPTNAGEMPESDDIKGFGLNEIVSTDLTESDVVMGAPEKLDRALEEAVRQQERHGRTIFFSNTCVPVVIGEDVESKVDRIRAHTGCPMLYLTVTPRSMVNVFQELLVDNRVAAEKKAPPAPPHTVNLVGFQRGEPRDELVKLLEDVGVEVNACFLPDMSYELVEQLPGAGVNVYYPNQLWQHLYDQVRFSSRITPVEPPPPYGMEGTRRWIAAVAEAAGAELDIDAWWAKARAPYQNEWNELREEAREHRVVLVARSQEVYFLTRPEATWGIPVIRMLEEMGFGIDVLLRVTDKETARRAAAEVHEQFSTPQRHTIKGFNSFEMMLRRMKESPAHAALSYHFFDWRVTQGGKNPFSLQQFEMGLAGALQTLRQLLGVCRTPFYRRYGRYLGRTTSGLRRPYEGDGGAS